MGTFPALSAKWSVSSESFWKKIKPVVSNAGIRFSYGATGNDNTAAISNYPFLTLIQTGIAPNGGLTIINGTTNGVSQITGAFVPVAGNPDLVWESQKTYNAGLDLGFLKNRITVTIEAYVKTSDGLLFNAPIPTSTGFKTLLQNIGKYKTKDWNIRLIRLMFNIKILNGHPVST
ncbi:TonB-dependent receptor domain-containing protein [Niabella hibiscisoli]|uniref:TonB-dependent receptor domain-containing protein n=1 Tax=Niabella hibiscisoli TaxID=1825928 RepID=UPI001F116531|nr:TonB-dependent receptor [Niabella hibiscisoli]MCH5718379.1 TonB-dependent receptor [Niabella hibiscisoli]